MQMLFVFKSYSITPVSSTINVHPHFKEVLQGIPFTKSDSMILTSFLTEFSFFFAACNNSPKSMLCQYEYWHYIIIYVPYERN
jgi:hypothetical protein